MKKTMDSSERQRPRNYASTITINFDRLENLIRVFATQIKDRIAWWAPFGIGVTLLVTLVVSDFKDDLLGISGERWETAFILGCIVAFAVAGVWFRQAKNGQGVDELMATICGESSSRPRHYGLALFKAENATGVAHFLVYYDDVWECYLLPYVRLHDDQSDPEDVSEPAADRFNLSKTALSARELDGHIVEEEKISAATRRVTNYRFAFYIMRVVDTEASKFVRKTFQVQSRKYKWLTIEQALAHPKSREKNGGVFDYLRDNYRTIIQNPDIPNAIASKIP